jgi:hypothetical protein
VTSNIQSICLGVAKTDEGHPERLQFSDRVDEVAQGTPEPVKLPDEHDIELPLAGIRHQSVQRWPGVFGSRHSVDVLTDYAQPGMLRELP